MSQFHTKKKKDYLVLTEEKSMKKLVFFITLISVFSINASAASTGTFTGPKTNAILSVDLNGGSSGNRTNEGWNGSAVFADPYGVTWSPWGGPTNQGGDGTTLPTGTGTTMSKTFGTKTITISLPGTASNYASGLNSTDKGNPTGAATDNDMFRDFLYVSGYFRQGANYMQIQVSGLTSGWSYQMALFSYDSTNTGKFMNWTATAPYSTANGYYNGSIFAAPADEQTISFSSKGAPAVFTLTANGSGVATVWGWGGDGITNHQSADPTVLNGFQIVQVTPEPATIVLLGLGLTMLRNKKNGK
jgi:hypothetical protein